MKKTSLKDHLEGNIPDTIISKVNRSFEVVGDIAIIETDSDTDVYSKEIGSALLKVNSNIKTVLKKSGIHQGEFRTQDLLFVCGEEKFETIYMENGIKLLLNPSTVYFSSKLGTERGSLSSNVKIDSKVLVMFSGCGPYTFNILRKQPDISRIDSIEINPDGHKYALKNLELNRNLLKKSNKFKEEVKKLKEEGEYINDKDIVSKINSQIIGFYNGDVRKIMDEELRDSKYDEIFMPLPKDAEHFLDVAFKAAEKGCLVHMYDFVHSNEFPHLSEDKVKSASKKFGREVEIVETRKVGQYSPRKYRVCCEFRIIS